MREMPAKHHLVSLTLTCDSGNKTMKEDKKRLHYKEFIDGLVKEKSVTRERAEEIASHLKWDDDGHIVRIPLSEKDKQRGREIAKKRSECSTKLLQAFISLTKQRQKTSRLIIQLLIRSTKKLRIVEFGTHGLLLDLLTLSLLMSGSQRKRMKSTQT